MSPPTGLEVWLSLAVQLALLSLAARCIERRVADSRVLDRLWAAYYAAAVALTLLAWCGPHVRWMRPVELFPPHTAARVLLWEERAAYLVLGTWLCGVTVAFLRLLVGMWRAARVVRRARPADAALRRRLLGGMAKASGRHAIDLRISRRDCSPFCWQIGRPAVILPESLLGADAPVADAELRAVVQHELGHLRAGHPLQLFLQRVVECLHWYHPLVKRAAKCAAAQREFAADQAAASNRQEAIVYLKALLTLCQVAATPRPLPAGLPLVAAPSLLQQRAARLVRRDWNRPLPRGQARFIAQFLVLGCLCTLAWLPVNVIASSRSLLSPWPRWSASTLRELGWEVRDYEIDAHRLPHRPLLERRRA
jgi:beta-lactamase regulating signal transducer with metallopeptidase domain